MIDRPPKSRNQLEWYKFEHRQGESWFFCLPPYYAALFEEQESSLMQKSNTGWRNSKSGKAKFAFFKDLDANEVEQIQSFIEDYKRLLILGVNRNIRNHFENELDFCVALDYNFQRDETRTVIGHLEYLAKYRGSEDAIEELIALLTHAIQRIPCGGSLRRCLSYVPPSLDKDFHLPEILAARLANRLGSFFFPSRDGPLVYPTLHTNKRSSKDLPVKQKIAEWGSIIQRRAVVLSRSVEGYTVYLLDDLYQSGVTIWSFAKYLKSVGADAVYGLVCVKSLRDTDNR
jgi:hypothetical protein